MVGLALRVIVTSSVEDGHDALVIVHRNTFGPTPKPVTPLPGEAGEVTEPEPLTNVHAPVPVVGVFPARVAVVAHTTWSGPAADVVGGATRVTVTSSKLAVHGGLLIVQRNTLAPMLSPVTPLFGALGVETDPPPLIVVHVPEPLTGVFPASVAVVAQTDWFGPALAVVGVALRVIVTSSKLAVQGGLLIVHRNTFAPAPKPETPLPGELGELIDPLPLTKDHWPLPTVAVFPASVALVAQTVWFEPAFALVGVGTTSTVIELLQADQQPFPARLRARK